MRRPALSSGRATYAADDAIPLLPDWAAELVAAMEPEVDLEATPTTLRRARRLARLIDASPDVHPGRVALFVAAFDGLVAQRIEHIATQAESQVMQRLRARAAGLQGRPA